MNVPIGDPRPAGTEGDAGDQRPTGDDGPAGDPRPTGEDAAGDGFDPADHTAAEVQAHLADTDDAERDRILDAERDGKNRKSLTS